MSPRKSPQKAPAKHAPEARAPLFGTTNEEPAEKGVKSDGKAPAIADAIREPIVPDDFDDVEDDDDPSIAPVVGPEDDSDEDLDEEDDDFDDEDLDDEDLDDEDLDDEDLDDEEDDEDLDDEDLDDDDFDDEQGRAQKRAPKHRPTKSRDREVHSGNADEMHRLIENGCKFRVRRQETYSKDGRQLERWPIAGAYGLESLSGGANGDHAAAIRKKFNGRPGEYLVEVFDPKSKRVPCGWRRLVTIAATGDRVEMLRQKVAQTKVEVELEDARSELEEARSRRGGKGLEDRLLAIEISLQRLASSPPPPPPGANWLEIAKVAIPPLVAFIADSSRRQASSMTNLMREFVPALGGVMKAQVEGEAAAKQREFDLAKTILRAQLAPSDAPQEGGGVTEFLMQTIQKLPFFQSAAKPAAPVPAPSKVANEPAPRRKRRAKPNADPSYQFFHRLVICYGKKMTPEQATVRVLRAWGQLPDELYNALVEKDQSGIIPFIQKLPAELSHALGAVWGEDSGRAFFDRCLEMLIERDEAQIRDLSIIPEPDAPATEEGATESASL